MAMPGTAFFKVASSAALGAGLALVRSAFLSAQPFPLPALDLALIATIGLIATYRFPQALALAAASGLTRDALTAEPFGVQSAIAFTLTMLLIILFTRVFTDISFLSVSIMSASGFALERGLQWLAASVMHLFGVGGGAESSDVGSFLAALLLQLALCLAALLFISKPRDEVRHHNWT